MQEKYMKLAINQALKARTLDEVPVGAIIVKDGKVIAKAHNLKESKGCCIYHAEIIAIQKASKIIGDWRLNGCEMYVTLEPCAMCMGAIVSSRIDKLYFGAKDEKTGCGGSVLSLNDKFENKVEVKGGILGTECASIIVNYFKSKR